jgi:hypothetical protein
VNSHYFHLLNLIKGFFRKLETQEKFTEREREEREKREKDFTFIIV